MKAGTTVPHGEDYADAHFRHWTDAELLYGRERWPNADYLYGLSAECGLKAVMRRLGMPAETPSKYRKHVRELWRKFKNFARGRDGSRYLQLLPGRQPFADWSIDDRYAHRMHFDEGRVGPHREAARRIGVMVRLAKQGGSA